MTAPSNRSAENEFGATEVENAYSPVYSVKTAWSAVRFSFRSSWRLSRPRTLGLIVLPLVQGILPAALALVVRGLINTIADETSVNADLTFWIGLSLLFSFLLATTVPVQRTLERINGEHLENDLVVRMLNHANSLDFAYFESPRFRDHIAQATATPGLITNDLIDKTSRSLASLFTLVSLTAVLTAIEPRLLIWLPPVALPYLVHRWWISRIRYETFQRQWRSRRWAEYLTASLLDDRKLPEARLLNLSPLFTRRTDSRLQKIFHQNRALHRRELTGTILFNILALAVIHFALWQVAKRALNGEVTVGDVAVFAGATGAIRNAVDGFVASVGTLRYNVLNVRHLEHFLGLSPTFPEVERAAIAKVGTKRSADSESPVDEPALVVSSLGFRYPETDIDVLQDVSFEVAEGETVALVGSNGSGKTTLVKLITGLYMPTSGEVRLQGTPTAELDRLDFHRRVSVVFQQFDTYEATAAENISLGDWENLLEDNDAIRAIAETTGVLPLIDKLPNGFETELGRSFGSTALSGGQQQIFALARASARPVPIMILDEPTANLDAQTEYELFQNFKELASGRATLLISHRFSTLALADRIVVLEDGKAAEQGHHEELLAAGGLYADMYRKFRYPAEGSTRT